MRATQKIPRSVEWAAVILVAIPILFTVIGIGSGSTQEDLVGWIDCTIVWIFYGGFAIAIAFGANWARRLLAIIALLGIGAWFLQSQMGFHAYIRGRHPLSYVEEIFSWVHCLAYCVAVALCFLPNANDYFCPAKNSPGRLVAR